MSIYVAKLPQIYKCICMIFYRVRFWLGAALLQALLLPLSACIEKPQAKDFEAVFELKIAQKTLFAQIATTDAQKARGLMFRESLPADGAMVFAFDAPRQMSFWMKNTLIPLDIAFLTADGAITEIKSMFPLNLNPVKSSRSDILYCIETNAGWFAKNGLSAGDKLDMQIFLKALKQRKAAE